MTTHSFFPPVPAKHLIKCAEALNWFDKSQITRLLYGREKRSRRVEILLPRLVSKQKLVSRQYHKKIIYIVPRLAKAEDPQIEHGLGVSEGLVRFLTSDRSAEVIPSRRFEGCGVRPEFGLKFADKILLYEFCTKDNCERSKVLKNKFYRYSSLDYQVLFVLDIPKDEVYEKIRRLKPEGKFLFTDYETFKSIPLGQQLTAPIYIWSDLNVYPLRHESNN